MENTVTVNADDYAATLWLAYKAAILKDVLFANAALGYKGKSLFFMASTDIDAVAKYLFPDSYAEKLAELAGKKRARDEKDRLVGLMNKKNAEDGKEGADDGR